MSRLLSGGVVELSSRCRTLCNGVQLFFAVELCSVVPCHCKRRLKS
jgi:hypothetical protein